MDWKERRRQILIARNKSPKMRAISSRPKSAAHRAAIGEGNLRKEVVDLGWLFQQTHPVPFSGCWLWHGSLNTRGYARVMIDRKRLTAHRVSYELKYGPIPNGLQLDHLCRVKCCINPDHVEPVTASINKRRADAARKGLA